MTNATLDQLEMIFVTVGAQLDGLRRDYTDAGRQEQTLRTGRKIVVDLRDALASVAAHPYRDDADNLRLIKDAQAKARDQLAPLLKIKDALAREVEQQAELPASASQGVDPEDVRLTRARLETLDPLLILGEYQSGDPTVVAAANGANPAAYPNIARMFASNDKVRRETVIKLRYTDPEARRTADDKDLFAKHLNGVIGDIERLVGGPDELQRMAQGIAA